MDWLRTLIARLRAFRQHLANRRTFKLQLLSAVGDGRLTPDQISPVDSLKKQLQLSDDDVRPFRFKAYLSAYSAVKRDRVITREEDVGLDGVQRYLGIVDSEIAGPKRAGPLQAAS